ncbi:PAS domain S-box protein [Flavisolibacter sp. BT320]|nr:PAS domain S-box protein [Flavisolibacter longurius]
MEKEIAYQQSLKSEQVRQLVLQNRQASDRMMNYFLAAYFTGGLLLSFFYETWLIALGVGSLSLLAYYATKWLLPESNAYQYVLGVVLGIFMAQYIYQMHGMFEMHFAAFISSAVLITYQNWKLQIPLTIVVVVHHAAFSYLQFAGVDNIYFTVFPYMELGTFVIHILLACAIFFICGLWAYQFNRVRTAHMEQTFQLGLLQEKERHTAEERKTQERVMQSEANLRAVVNNTDVAFFLLDTTYKIVSFNENASALSLRIHNRPMQAGTQYLDYIADNRKHLVLAAVERVANREILQYQVCYPHFHTGEKIWVQVSMYPVTDEQQQLIGMNISMTDISESKRLQEQVAMERALKQEQITEAVFAAQEKERSELGRELHDNVNQLLAASALYMQTARTADDSDTLLATSISYTQTAIEEIRTLAKKIVTPRLNDFGLMNSLRGLAEDIMAVHEIQIRFTNVNMDEDDFDEKFKLNLFRIVQEQINNTLKYAKAKTIEVRFAIKDNHLHLFTTDDGVGFQPKQRKKGVGLTNMISRAELYKGEFTIDSAPGQGCYISVRFPLQGLQQSNQIKLYADYN